MPLDLPLSINCAIKKENFAPRNDVRTRMRRIKERRQDPLIGCSQCRARRALKVEKPNSRVRNPKRSVSCSGSRTGPTTTKQIRKKPHVTFLCGGYAAHHARASSHVACMGLLGCSLVRSGHIGNTS